MLCKADMSGSVGRTGRAQCRAERRNAEQIKNVEYHRRLPGCWGVFCIEKMLDIIINILYNIIKPVNDLQLM